MRIIVMDWFEPAALLKAIDHPRADEIARQAQQYIAAVRTRFFQAMEITPSFDYGMEYFNLCSLVKLSAADVGLGESKKS